MSRDARVLSRALRAWRCPIGRISWTLAGALRASLRLLLRHSILGLLRRDVNILRRHVFAANILLQILFIILPKRRRDEVIPLHRSWIARSLWRAHLMSTYGCSASGISVACAIFLNAFSFAARLGRFLTLALNTAPGIVFCSSLLRIVHALAGDHWNVECRRRWAALSAVIILESGRGQP